MPSKKDVQKRRLAREQGAEAQAHAVSARDRRKRWTIGLIGGIAAVALILPLAAGLVSLFDSDPEPPPLLPAEIESATIRPIPEGSALTGATPCPATDGTQERTTSFEEPPGLCIDPALDYDVVLTTDLGEIHVGVDPALDEEAANLFVTMARYGLYDDMPFTVLVPEGLAVSGDPGELDPGFSIAPSAPADAYEIGSVVMFADLPETIASRFAFITTQRFADLFGEDPIHPVIGSVTGGMEVIDAIIAIGSSPDTSPLPVLDIRIISAAVSEVG